MRRKLLIGMLSISMMAYMCTGCQTEQAAQTTQTTSQSQGVAVQGKNEDGIQITLQDNNITADSQQVTIEGNVVTITTAGTYVFTGELSDGRIVVEVDKEEDVELVLNGVDITCSDYAPIQVVQAGNVTIDLAAGSVNVLTDGETYAVSDEEDTTDGVIFSKDDLKLKGDGTLYINGNYKHGIVAKDDLEIKSGTYIIQAVEDGVNANDSITIEGGAFTVEAGDDGMHVEELFTINNGTITITKSTEGLEGHQVIINNGVINITATDDGINSNSADNETTGNAEVNINMETEGSTDSSAVASEEGTTSEGMTMPEGGMTGERPEMPTDGTVPEDMSEMFADGTMPEGGMTGERPEMPTDGTMPEDMSEMFADGTMPEDGMAGKRPEMPTDGTMPEDMSEMFADGTMPEDMAEMFGDGTVPEGEVPTDGTATQDGMTRGQFGGGGKMQGGGMMGGMETDEDSLIQINGGVITVDAGGDGLDSNGYLEVTGGEVYVSGAANSGNGAIDYGIKGTISGGTVIAAGFRGMAQNFSNESTQYSMLYNASGTQAAGTQVVVKDNTGKEILTWSPTKEFNCIVISSPDMEDGAEYTVELNGNGTV